MAKKVYSIDNLDCANCAAKIEKKFNDHPGVEEAVITFATKQLRLTAEDPDALIPELVKIARTVEGEVTITPREAAKGAAHPEHSHGHHQHDHGDGCCCGEHHREDEEECGCRHEHHHGDGEGCGHEHHHEDGEDCCCGHEHHHEDGESCGCGHGHHHEHAEGGHGHASKVEREAHGHDHGDEEKSALPLILGAGLFVLGLVLNRVAPSWATLLVCLVAYGILGWEVVMTAARNLVKGHVFDENFLMSVATIGAFFVGEYPEAVGVMLFYRVGEFFEHKAVERSRSQIMEAVDLRPEVVQLVDGDQVREIPAGEARVGDLVLVRPGDRVPLDGVVVSGQSRLDTAPITGEPVPVSVGEGDCVTSGCVNTVGQLTVRVEKPLAESMVTRILDSVENAAASKPKMDRFITRFARIYTPVVVAVALGTAVIPSLFTGNWGYWVYTALTFLVMSCPCALVLSVPLAFFAGIGAGSKKGILFKGGQSMEAMAGIKAVVMDKTGTITKGDFKVQKVESVLNLEQVDARKELLGLCASCEQRSTHPIAVSIVAAAKEQGLALTQPEELEELPGRGIRAVVEGKEVLCGNARLMREKGVAFTDTAEYGTRVLVAMDGAYQGYLLIADTVKPGAEQAVRRLRDGGIETVMLTGDAEEAAKAVASAVGIREVHGGLLPHQKLERLQAIRQEKGAAMFVGDGINDAPVLAGADVGAAMGSGADAAIEAADVVFMTSDVEAVPQALGIAKETSRIAWQNVVFALAVKLVVMFLGLRGYASMWLAVFADSGVAMLCVLNSIRLLYKK